MGLKPPPARIVLHVDELVLRGIDAADAAAFVAALQSGLATGLRLPGALDGRIGQSSARIDATARVGPDADTGTMARAIAHNITAGARK